MEADFLQRCLRACEEAGGACSGFIDDFSCPDRTASRARGAKVHGLIMNLSHLLYLYINLDLRPDLNLNLNLRQEFNSNLNLNLGFNPNLDLGLELNLDLGLDLYLDPNLNRNLYPTSI